MNGDNVIDKLSQWSVSIMHETIDVFSIEASCTLHKTSSTPTAVLSQLSHSQLVVIL
jgi:hypothetical protein